LIAYLITGSAVLSLVQAILTPKTINSFARQHLLVLTMCAKTTVSSTEDAGSSPAMTTKDPTEFHITLHRTSNSTNASVSLV
jgi:hypothetical protein